MIIRADCEEAGLYLGWNRKKLGKGNIHEDKVSAQAKCLSGQDR
jgi:hypothetical protein